MKHPTYSKKFLFDHYCPNCHERMCVRSVYDESNIPTHTYECIYCEYSEPVSVFDEVDQDWIYGDDTSGETK